MGLKHGRPIPFAAGGFAGRFRLAGGESTDKVVPGSKLGWRVSRLGLCMKGSSPEQLGNGDELGGGKKLDGGADNWSSAVKE
jgi:hypothetical protein